MCDVHVHGIIHFFVGGLGFSAKEIGLSLAVAGGVLLPIGLVLYPLVRRIAEANTPNIHCLTL